MAHAQKNIALLDARQAAGLTQVGLAARSGVSQSVISSMQGGHVPGALASAIRIARALDTTVEALFGALVAVELVEQPAPQPPAPPTPPTRTRKPRASKRTQLPGPAKARTPKRAPHARAVG